MSDISVVIPVKNGAETLHKCLTAIRNQTIKDVEIIILDSCSKDESVKIATLFGAKIVNIPEGTFNHGSTRNKAVEYCTSNFIFFTVQDAYLSSDTALENMRAHFLNDETVMGVVGHQAVESGDVTKNPAAWFKRYSLPEITVRYFPKDQPFSQLPTVDQFKMSSWDNVVAMYRKSALLSIPFAATKFSEDWIWAREALSAQFKLITDSSIVVFHYHHSHFKYAFKTSFTIHYHFYIFFKKVPKSEFLSFNLFRKIFGILKGNIKFSKKIFWIIHNVFIFLAINISFIIFRFLLIFNSRSLLDKAYTFFCKNVPQGELKN
jgi:rhamnosyltransferase